MIHVFLGPTLAHRDADALVDAVLHPPVAQGDVLRACADGATTIAIIDGYFELVPSVWHKEILLAMENGVTVCGAASMGALRAAELAPLGMIGVGKVFDWFAGGVLTDDDEVAIVHAPAEDGYRPLSEAMVDIRYRLGLAEEAGLTDAETTRLLTDSAKALHYPDRSLRRVIDSVDPTSSASVRAQLDRLRVWVATPPPGIKERDAVELLTLLANGAIGAGAAGAGEIGIGGTDRRRSAAPGARPVERTVFLDQLETEVARRALVDADGRDPASVTDPDTVLPHGETLGVTRKKVLLRLLIRREAARLGLEVSPGELQAAADDFRRSAGLLSYDETLAWFAGRHISEAAWTAFLRDRVLAAKLDRLLDREIDGAVADHVRLATDP